MKILAMDTSSNRATVALLEDNKLIKEKHINDSKTHSEKLMPLIDEVLKANNVTLNDIDLFACGVGPGSFTGVRIGVSTVKGFVDSTKKPCIPVSSFESLACSALREYFREVDFRSICVLIDAKNDSCYYGTFFKAEDSAFKIVDDSGYASNDEILNKLKEYPFPIIFIGDAANNLKYKILEKYPKSVFAPPQFNDLNAENVGICGYYKQKLHMTGDGDILNPIYLRKSEAERKLDGED